MKKDTLSHVKKMMNNVQDDSLQFVEQVQSTPSETHDGGWDTVDELKEINLGEIEDPKPILDGVLVYVKN